MGLNLSFAQDNSAASNDFWKKVRYGGAIGMNFGSNYTEKSFKLFFVKFF
jgi:hypothetical protein